MDNKSGSEAFHDRFRANFPAVYLTTMSIIQGVALGLLASNTFSHVNSRAFTGAWIDFLPYPVMSFMMILIVSFEYTWFISVFQSPPEIWDTVIPFVLGFLEIAPTFYLTEPSTWWLFNSVFCLFGTIAFLNTLRIAKRDLSTNQEVQDIVMATLHLNSSISIVASAFSLCVGIALAYRHWELAPALLLILLGVYMLYRDEKLLARLRGYYVARNSQGSNK